MNTNDVQLMLPRWMARDIVDNQKQYGDTDIAEMVEMQINSSQKQWIDYIQDETHSWRMEKWPDVTPMGQTFGTAIEVMELGELLWKAEHYDDEWADRCRLQEEAGDVMIYLLGVMSLLDMDATECIEAALEKNEDRDWDAHMEAPQ